jgi:hypothetical protein
MRGREGGGKAFCSFLGCLVSLLRHALPLGMAETRRPAASGVTRVDAAADAWCERARHRPAAAGAERDALGSPASPGAEPVGCTRGAESRMGGATGGR